MTPEQREHLEALARDSAITFRRVAIAAALADLDACRAALGPIVCDLKQCWMDRHEPAYIELEPAQANAVLAAAGESS